jgi:hypothetical protein
MSIDPVEALAMQRVVRASAEIEVALLEKNNPIVHVLSKAKKAAVAAIVQLVDVDPSNVENVRKLQNEVHRFDDLIVWLQDIVREGFENNRRLASGDRDEFADMLSYEPDGSGNALDADEAEEAGIMERGSFDA